MAMAEEDLRFFVEFLRDDDSDDDNFDGFTADDVANAEGPNQERLYLNLTDFTPAHDADHPDDVQSGWKRFIGDVTKPPISDFTGASQLLALINVDMRPIDFFKLFIDDALIETFAEQTNEYASQKQSASDEGENKYLGNWRPVTSDEMKVFLSVVLNMGLLPKLNLKSYWVNKGSTRTPWFSKTMSRDRFLHILWNFHISDIHAEFEQDPDNRDRLFKVRPLIDHCLTRFSSAYAPLQDLSVDEALCPFKGRLSFKVYNPAKPHKFGIKLYTLCESESGYCLYFDVYTAQTSPMQALSATADLPAASGQTEKIVVGLLQAASALNKGHHVYMDNYYTSPNLFEFLSGKDTFACGTVRSNRRGLPAAFADPRNGSLQNGEIVVRLKGSMVAVKFQHKRTVNMLSTIHDATGYIKYKPRRPVVMKPTCIHDYCSKMGGVDLMDQVTQYYEIARKSFKWWRKLAFYLIDISMVNAYQLHRKFSTARLSHSDFRESVISALVAEAESVRPPAPQRGACRNPPEARLTERHFSSFIPSKPGAKRKHGARDCVVCNLPSSARDKFKRVQTSHWCEDCEVPLCYPDCFKLFHTVLDYKQEARRREYGAYRKQ